jgi:hypothetical protein
VSSRTQAAGGYRLRPAPRRTGARQSRVRWDKVGRVALVLVFAAVMASYVSPALNFFDAWRDSKSERSSLAELQAENAKLHQRLATVDGSDAAERAARKGGMVQVGEGAYYVRGLDR